MSTIFFGSIFISSVVANEIYETTFLEYTTALLSLVFAIFFVCENRRDQTYYKYEKSD